MVLVQSKKKQENQQACLLDSCSVVKYYRAMTNKSDSNMIDAFTYIDLFSGAGGFSLGFDKAGFKNVFSIDIDNSFCQTYKKNFPQHVLIEKDITKLTNKEIRHYIKNSNINVVIGGPPCQGFSIAGNIGRKFLDDERNHLFKEFIRIVDVVQPDFFVMENVARLYTHKGGKTRESILNEFRRIGYNVDCRILNAVDYGVPQNRRRVIFIGSRVVKKISFPREVNKEYISVGKVLHDLPELKSGEESDIPNHVAMNHSAQMLNKMKYISDGGSRNEIPKELRPQKGDARKYIRYDSKKPSITVTGDMRKVFHYKQNRALTVRELARLQSFPDNFVFVGNSISQQQQVGNSVPPLLAKAIANELKFVLEINNGK